jgi:hypothetical protein
MPWASLVSKTRTTAHRLLGGVSVTAGAVSGTGQLDVNSELLMSGQIVSVDYALSCATALFGLLQYDDLITVDGGTYRVQHEPLRIGDGADCIVPLSKVDAPVGATITTLDSLLLTTLDGRYLVTL